MKNISGIGLGTAAIGRPQYINIKQEIQEPISLSTFKERGIKMLDYAYDSGVRYYDTAPGYGFAEQLLIDWVNKKNDPGIIVATKWGYTYVANFEPNAKVHEVKEHSLNKLNEQWEASKKLLPNLKYYQIHSLTLESGVLENDAVLERLFELKETYNIKVGLTVTGSNQAEVLQKGIDVQYNGEQLFEVFQCTYNVLDQSIYDMGYQIISEGKQLVIKEALANGRLFSNADYPGYDNLYKKVEAISRKYAVGIDAINLQFCLAKLKGAIVLSGANNPKYLEQNLKATKFQLNRKEVEQLSQFKISPKIYWEERKRLIWN